MPAIGMIRLLTVSALTALTPAAAQTPPAETVGLSAQPSVYEIGRVGAPLPIRVLLDNPSARFEGAIEAAIETEPGRSADTARRVIAIGKGRFQFFLYPQVREDAPEIRTRPRPPGSSTAGTTLPASGPELFARIRLLDQGGQEMTAMTLPLHMNVRPLAIAAVNAPNRRLTRSDLAPLDASVAALSPARLPDAWYGYKMFDAVFWDARTDAAPDAQQREALSRWVRGGGRLVLCAKAGDAGLVSPVPELLPTVTLKPAAHTPARYFEAVEFPGCAGRLFAEKRAGLGRLLFLQRDYNDLSAADAEEMAALVNPWRHHPDPPLYPGVSFNSSAISAGSPPGFFMNMAPNYTDYFTASATKPILARLCGYTTLRFPALFCTMLVYLALVSAADYLVLRKIGKLPWTWATFPLLIVGFSLIAYGVFYTRPLGALKRHAFVFQDYAPDGYVRILSLNCLRNNSHTPLRWTLADNTLVSLMEEPTYRRSEPEEIERWETRSAEGASEIALPAPIGAFRFFKEETWGLRRQPPLTCRLTDTDNNGGLWGAIACADPALRVEHVRVYYNHRLYVYDPAAGLSAGKEVLQHLFVFPNAHDPTSSKTVLNMLSDYAVNDFFSYRRAVTDSMGGAWDADLSILPALGPRQAVVFACYTAQTNSGGVAAQQFVCIRQIVDLAP